MIDETPQSCSLNEFIALIVYLNSWDLLKENAFNATGVVFTRSLCLTLTRCLLSLLCLWHGKVPGGILGTLPHSADQTSEAHVLGFLQSTHQPLLHNGYELLITKLSVPCGRQTGGEEDDFHLSADALFALYKYLQWCQLLTITVKQSEHHIAHVIRQLHLGYCARHLLHGNWETEGTTDREIHRLWEKVIEVLVDTDSHTSQLINGPCGGYCVWVKLLWIDSRQGSYSRGRLSDRHEKEKEEEGGQTASEHPAENETDWKEWERDGGVRDQEEKSLRVIMGKKQWNDENLLSLGQNYWLSDFKGAQTEEGR